MEIQLEKAGAGQAKMSLIGEMTIFHINDIKESLVKQFSEANELQIDLSGVSEIDTAGLQLLILLKNEASKKKKKLILAEHSQPVVDLLEVSHLHQFFGDPVLLLSAQTAEKSEKKL